MPNKYKPTEQELQLAQDATDIKRANDIIQEAATALDMSSLDPANFEHVTDTQNYIIALLAARIVQLEKEVYTLKDDVAGYRDITTEYKKGER